MKKDDIAKEITKNLKKDNKKKWINNNKGKCIEPNASHTRIKLVLLGEKVPLSINPMIRPVICGQCELQGIYHEQKKGGSGSTTALLMHLKTKHHTFWSKHEGLPDEKQKKVSSYFYGMAGWTRNGKQSNKVDHSLVWCVIAKYLSPCIIYSPELKELLPTQYILPNSTEFAELLKKKYVETKKKKCS